MKERDFAFPLIPSKNAAKEPRAMQGIILPQHQVSEETLDELEYAASAIAEGFSTEGINEFMLRAQLSALINREKLSGNRKCIP